MTRDIETSPLPPERASLLSFSSPCLTVRNRLLLELFAIFVTAKVSEGWLMPRGEGALIVARVGLQSQIVTQSTYAIVVFMTAVTNSAPATTVALSVPDRE